MVFSESSRRKMVSTIVEQPLASLCDFEAWHQSTLTHAGKITDALD